MDNRNGPVKLFYSAKAWFSLIMLACCTVVAMTNHMSAAYAAVISSIVVVFTTVHGMAERKAMDNPIQEIKSVLAQTNTVVKNITGPND